MCAPVTPEPGLLEMLSPVLPMLRNVQARKVFVAPPVTVTAVRCAPSKVNPSKVRNEALDTVINVLKPDTITAPFVSGPGGQKKSAPLERSRYHSPSSSSSGSRLNA